MCHERILGEHVWYEVCTAVNIGDPLFLLPWAKVLLYRVFRDAKGIFPFDICGLMFEGASPYIIV